MPKGLDESEVHPLHHRGHRPHSPNFRVILRDFFTKAKQMSLKQLCAIFILCILVTGGNAMNIIGINFWVRSFEGNPGTYTTLMVSGLVFTLFFLVIFLGYVLVQRPKMGWALSSRALWTLFWIGFWDATNSWLTIYATFQTPEILQALFISLAPLYTLLFTKYLLKDPRNYINRWIGTSFFLMAISVVLAALPDFTDASGKGGEIGKKKKIWSIIFFIAVPQMSLFNVLQARYMKELTYSPAKRSPHGMSPSPSRSPQPPSVLATPEKTTIQNSADDIEEQQNKNQRQEVVVVEPATQQEEARGVENDEMGYLLNSDVSSPVVTPIMKEAAEKEAANNERKAVVVESYAEDQIPDHLGSDTTVKMFMLFGDTGIQWLLCFAFLPADALPWFGQSHSVADAWQHLRDGLGCLFTCRNNFIFCLIYSFGYVFTYIGGAYLNQYSATLCSLVTQLSSPLTAFLLIIVPAWNCNIGVTPWYLSTLSVTVMMVGTIVYCVWEEATSSDSTYFNPESMPVSKSKKTTNDRGNGRRERIGYGTLNATK